jgi:hypothetical protein
MWDLKHFLVKEMEYMQKNPHWTQPVSNPRYSLQTAQDLNSTPQVSLEDALYTDNL